MHARSATDINQHYRTLRPQLLMYMVIGYAAFYLTRKSVNYVLPALQTDLGLDKGDIGLLGSLFYLAYGVSKFTAGLWHDSHGQRWFMGVGLFATGLLNVVFAFGESLTLLLAVLLQAVEAAQPGCTFVLESALGEDPAVIKAFARAALSRV